MHERIMSTCTAPRPGRSSTDSPRILLTHHLTPSHAFPPPHAPLSPHAIELAPMISYPLSHVKSHAGLVEAGPPAHEAPAVVVEAATSMGRQTGSQVGNACQAPSMVRMWMTMHERGV